MLTKGVILRLYSASTNSLNIMPKVTIKKPTLNWIDLFTIPILMLL